MTNRHPNLRIGEVVEATSQVFTAQCFELFKAPPLGSLVKTGGELRETLAIVCEIGTKAIDPSRIFTARGRDAASEEEIYRDHPQLNQILRTDFEAVVVGHYDEVALRQYLPPLPAKVHSFVYVCQDDEVHKFVHSLDFLSMVTNGQVPNQDEVLGAFLRAASRSHEDPEAFLLKSGKALATLLAKDVTRLSNILKRISP